MMVPQRAAPPEQSFGSFADFYQNSAYSQFQPRHRSGGGLGAQLVRVDQDPIDLIDPPLPDYFFCIALTSAREVGIDLGDGITRHTNTFMETLNVVPPNTEARFIISCPHRLRFFAIPAATLDPLLKEAGLSAHAFAHHYAGGRSYLPQPDIARLMNEMWRIAGNHSGTDSLYFDGLTLQLIALAAAAPGLSPLRASRPADARVARALDYLEAHLGEALSVSELAAVACLSVGHFARAFKATMGEAVWAYVQRRRCERAMERLRYTNDLIATIAHECGFSHQGHFTIAFKRRFGITPGQVRK